MLASGCGARSDLRVPSDAAVIDAPPPPPENACSAAIDPSAATAMRGYCSTRASLAPHPAPTAPTMGWMTQLPTDFEPIEMVVDGAGRTWATFDPVRGDDVLSPHSLFILDASGAIVASHDYRPDVLGNLYLARDGTLRATIGFGPRRFVRIGLDAALTELGTLPDHTFRFAPTSDGSLVMGLVDFHAPDRLARVAEDGRVLWMTEPIDPGMCAGCISDIALWPDDRSVVTSIAADPGVMDRFHTTVHARSADGAVLWDRTLEGIVTQGPSIALDGSLRLVLGVTDDAGATITRVTSLGERGEVVWQTNLAEDYEQTWENALPIAPDGTVFVHVFHAQIAVSAEGVVRWRNEEPTNLSYDAVVDAHGMLVTTFGPLYGIDAATGAERWRVDGPGPMGGTFFYVSDVVLAPHGCVVGASHGGMLFSACDP